MTGKNPRATLKSELMSSKVEKGNAGSRRRSRLEIPAGITNDPGLSPAVPADAAPNLLCAKGSATAAGFRPWHWSYEQVPAPGAEVVPRPCEPLSPAGAARAPVECPPAHAPSPLPIPPEPPITTLPVFEYPCNFNALAATEGREISVVPSPSERRAERAALLKTTKIFAVLIGKALEAKEAVALARREDQHRAHGLDPEGRRSGVGKPPHVSCESLLAELKVARRRPVSTLRKRVRPYGAALLASALSR